MDISQYNEETMKQQLAVLYSIDASLMTLAVIGGSVQLRMTIATASNGASGATFADIFAAINAVDDTVLSNALGVPVTSAAPKLSCPSGHVESIGADGIPFCSANLLDAGRAATCPAGKVELENNCLTCPRGHYCIGGVAVRCQDGTWLNTTGAANATDCRPCPSSGVRCVTGDELALLPGYYMASANDDRAYPCASEGACFGGVRYGDDSCTDGHFGVLCGHCSSFYYRSQRRCLPCAALTEDADPGTATIIATVIASFVIPILIRTYLLPPRYIVNSFARIKQTSVANRLSELLVIAAALTKIGISYCQSLSALNRIPDVHWPADFMRFMEALDRVFNLELFSVLPLECVKGSRIGFYTELLATLLMPVGVVLLPFLVVWLHRSLALRYRWWLEETTPGWKGVRKAVTHPRMYKLLTWTFLFIYPTLARKPLAVFVCIPAPGGTWVLRDDPVVSCHVGAWPGWAAAASLGVLFYGVGLPLAALSLAWMYRNSESSKRERVTLLVDSYRNGFWACESLTLAYKFVLTGLINILPDARLQIWLGVVGNLMAWAGVIVYSPFQSALCNAVASTALLQLLLNYICSFLFLGAQESAQIDLRTSGIGVLLIMLNCCCFAVLAVGSASSIWRARKVDSARRLRYEDGSEVHPPKLENKEYHLFLSHTWSQGEEAMRTIKLRLLEMIPRAKIFLDKDDMTQGNGSEHIEHSSAVLVFCTDKYLKSRACARELFRAVLLKKPLIVVLEPDETRGGLSPEKIKHRLATERYAPFREPNAAKDQPWAKRWALEQEVTKWGFDEIPTGQQIIEALFGSVSPAIEWNRFSAFQDATVRLIADRMLSVHDHWKDKYMYVKAELINQVLPPLTLKHGRSFHLYRSPHNVGAEKVVDELQQQFFKMRDRGLIALPKSLRATLRDQFSSLKETTSLAELSQCEHMLIYLTDATWTSGEVSHAFARDVSKALRLGVRLLLVHEMPSIIENDDSRGACEFDRFWIEGWTPPHLLTTKANIYKTIAIALKPDPLRASGLVAVLHDVASKCGSERNPIDDDDPRQRKLKRLRSIFQQANCTEERHGALTSAASKMRSSARPLAPSSGMPLPPPGQKRRLAQRLSMRLSRQRSHLDQDQLHERSSAGRVTTSCTRHVGRELPPSSNNHLVVEGEPTEPPQTYMV